MKKFHSYQNIRFEDLLAPGSLALWYAIGKSAQEERVEEHSLVNYTRTAIRNAQKDAVFSQIFQFDNVDHHPMNPYIKSKNNLMQRLGRIPTPTELALDMGITVEEVFYLDLLTRKRDNTIAIIPEKSEFNEDTGRVIWEGALHEYTPERPRASSKDQIRQIEWILEHIHSHHAKALLLKFGLEGGAFHTTTEISAILRTNRDHLGTILNNIYPELREIALQIADGTVDYKKLKGRGIRNVFALYHYLVIDPPEESVAQLKRHMKTMLERRISSQRDLAIIIDLYGLDERFHMPSAIEVADKFGLSKSSIGAIENKIIASFEAEKNSRKTNK